MKNSKAVIFLLFLSAAILLTGMWYLRFHVKGSKLPILLGILIAILDYVAIQYLSNYTNGEMLRMLWVRLAVALLIPIAVLNGSLSGWSQVASVFIIIGLVILLSGM